MSTCKRCARPKATDALWEHEQGCECPECVAHCWGSCQARTWQEERADVVRWLSESSDPSVFYEAKAIEDGKHVKR